MNILLINDGKECSNWGLQASSAALIDTLDVYQKDGLFDRVKDLAPYWEDALHSLKGTHNIIDILNLGLVGGVEMNPKNNQVGLIA